MGRKNPATSASAADKARGISRRVLSTVAMNPSTHESFARDEAAVPGSDRTFGLVMAAALAAVSLLNGWHHGRLWPWTSAAAVLFLLAAWLGPSSLRPLTRPWMELGLVLRRIV